MSEDEAATSERTAPITWFRRPGQGSAGVLNTSYNALDRHIIAGRADQPALVFQSTITGRRRTYRYAELLEKVAQLGGSLTAIGVRAGDTVIISLPVIPEAVIAMLACARIGAVHAVVDATLPSGELAARIDVLRPVVIIAASCVLDGDRVIPTKPVLDGALTRTSHQPSYCVILQRPELGADLQAPRDLDFGLLMRPGSVEPATSVDVAATDPLYVLGDDVVPNGANATSLAWSLPNVHGVQPGEVVLAPTTLATPTGHSLIVYGPLIIGATTVLIEGDPAAAGIDPEPRRLSVDLGAAGPAS